jgi:uncharacterized membrane protein YhaH (DUF805 family)
MSSANPYMAPRTGYALETQSDESWSDRSATWLLFSFRGRIPRIAFWSASFIVGCVHYGIIYFATKYQWIEKSPALAIVLLAVLLVTTWSCLAIQAKRWHDRNKSGFWFFINFVPLIGPFWALIENGFLRGTYGENAYGADSA